MAKRRKCEKCGAYNPSDATECGHCAVIFSDIVSVPGKFSDSKAPHDANPNKRFCKCGCGREASIFIGVLRGGGDGWASGCWKSFEQDNSTPGGTEISKEIRQFLKNTRDRVSRRREPEMSRTPGEDDE